MRYNPNIHSRRSIRLKGYDYSRAGLYFVTICCQDKIHRFGEIKNGEMILNDFGEIAHNEWGNLSKRYRNVSLDVFQIMPNHIHGIIVLDGVVDGVIDRAGASPAPTGTQNDGTPVGATLAVAPVANTFAPVANTFAPVANTFAPNTNTFAPINTSTPTIGHIVGAYKSLVTTQCLKIFKSKNKHLGKFWQRNYYENIICNNRTYQYIANYINNNPTIWEKDRFNLQSQKKHVAIEIVAKA